MPATDMTHLKPLPRSPSGVSSEALPEDWVHHVAPLAFRADLDGAVARMKHHALALPRTLLVDRRERYLHFTVASAMFGFIDDLELLFHRSGRIDVRSAARVGWTDFGVNRRRVEALRSTWTG